jgi:hypothetical protein
LRKGDVPSSFLCSAAMMELCGVRSFGFARWCTWVKVGRRGKIVVWAVDVAVVFFEISPIVEISRAGKAGGVAAAANKRAGAGAGEMWASVAGPGRLIPAADNPPGQGILWPVRPDSRFRATMAKSPNAGLSTTISAENFFRNCPV